MIDQSLLLFPSNVIIISSYYYYHYHYYYYYCYYGYDQDGCCHQDVGLQ